MTVDELKTKLDAGEPVHLLDVREDDERAEFNIGGVHHKLGAITAMNFDPIEEWKDAEVIIYCRSGNRSQVAGHVMEAAGFKQVTNLTGGMNAWRERFGG